MSDKDFVSHWGVVLPIPLKPILGLWSISLHSLSCEFLIASPSCWRKLCATQHLQQRTLPSLPRFWEPFTCREFYCILKNLSPPLSELLHTQTKQDCLGHFFKFHEAHTELTCWTTLCIHVWGASSATNISHMVCLGSSVRSWKSWAHLFTSGIRLAQPCLPSRIAYVSLTLIAL